jgi:hypothetical protein
MVKQASEPRLLALAVLVACAIAGCRNAADSQGQSFDPASAESLLTVDTTKIELFYVCGNEFNIRNYNPVAVPLTWTVFNSTDSGALTVPPPSAGAARSETHFVTNATNTVILFFNGVEINRYANQHIACTTPTPPPLPPPPPGSVDTTKVELFYVCGNEFNVRNYNPVDVPLTWKVLNTTDAGSLVAPPPTDGQVRSETHFTTDVVGTVQLFFNGTEINRYANLKTVCGSPLPPPPGSPPPPPPGPVVAGKGQWSAPMQWPVVGIHSIVLPTGKVLLWSRAESAQVWDPATNTFKLTPAPSWVFCAGQTYLPDGRVLVTGGHITDDHGLPDTNIFDPFTQTWTKVAPMREGRWYPTVVTMADGSALVLGGEEQDTSYNPFAEVRGSDGVWRTLTGASLLVPLFPFVFLAPDGRAFLAGSTQQTRFLDTSGAGHWTLGPHTVANVERSYGSAVMYEPGKILLMGGNVTTPLSSAETIDLNQAAPAWHSTTSMNHARRQMNATILPDGRVLATGGTSAAGFNNAAGAILEGEIWNPSNATWTTIAPMKIPRLYHSTAVLLPDARILSAGGGEGGGGVTELNAEIYSPPYLFNPDGSTAARPTIASAPAQVGYNVAFDVQTPDSANVSSVTLVRLPATTHGVNMNQRFLRLPFTGGAGSVTAQSPLKATLAPPGHYMLFLLNAQGVPSVAKMIQLQ